MTDQPLSMPAQTRLTSLPARCGIGIVAGAVVGRVLMHHHLTLVVLIAGWLSSRLWVPPVVRWLDQRTPPK